MRVFVSLLSVSDRDIARVVTGVSECVSGFHVDIMDTTFVPYEAGSLERVAQVRSLSNLPLWIHLMVDDPRRWVDMLALRDGDIISVHYEVYADRLEQLRRDLAAIRQQGARASLAFSPPTSLEPLNELIGCVDHVLIMGVVPGKSGQQMLGGTRSRLQEALRIRSTMQGRFKLGLDGGVSPDSLPTLRPYFPEDLVAGSSILAAQDPCQIVKSFIALSHKSSL